jgi:protein SCO1
MKRVALILWLLLGACGLAQAGVTAEQLNGVFVDAKPNAALPLQLQFTDESGKAASLGEVIGGRPAVLIFSDYTCSNLCGPILAFAAGALEKSGLTPSRDFRLVAVGLDPHDSFADMRQMRISRIGDGTPLAQATTMLTGSAEVIRAATAAAGYHYVYDREQRQFAHPAVAYVVTPQGHIARVLSGLGLNAADLRLALVDAGGGRVGNFADHIRLLCYGFDPATGIFSASIMRLLIAACLVTVVILAGALSLLAWRTRRAGT